MALAPCRDCGVEVSTDAAKCASCGARPPTRTAYNRRQRRIAIVATVVALLVLVAGVRIKQARDDEQQLRQACASLADSLEKAGPLARGTDFERSYRQNCG